MLLAYVKRVYVNRTGAAVEEGRALGHKLKSWVGGWPRIVLGVAVAGFVAVLALPSQTLALDLGQWVPGLKVAPFLTERVEYVSNVFQLRNPKEDVIYRTIPGVVVDYGQGPLTLSAAYRAEVLKFNKLLSQDNTHHIAAGQINVDLPKLVFNLRDDFTRTSDPPTTELVGRIESTTNALHPEFRYKLTDRFSLGGEFSWTYIRFPTVAQLDRNEYLYGGTAYWNVTEKLLVGLNFSHGEKQFQKVIIIPSQPNRDVERNIVTLRIRGDVTPKLSSGFSIGYERRDARAKNQPSESGVVFSGDWVYRLTERTRLSLLGTRGFEESTFGNTGLGLFFNTTSGTLTLDQKITDKITAFLRGTAVENRYEHKQSTALHPMFRHRDDTIYGWGGGLDYAIQKWLALGTEFSHTTRESNFREFKYQDDRITGKVTLQF